MKKQYYESKLQREQQLLKDPIYCTLAKSYGEQEHLFLECVTREQYYCFCNVLNAYAAVTDLQEEQAFAAGFRQGIHYAQKSDGKRRRKQKKLPRRKRKP